MFYKNFTTFVLITLFLFSCVSSGEYKAKLAEIDALKDDKARLEEKLNLKEKEIVKLNSEKEKLEDEIKNKDDELNVLKNKLEQKNKDIQALKEEKNEEERKRQKIIGDYDRLIKEYGELKKNLSASKEELTKEISELKKSLKENIDKISKIQEELTLKNKEIDNLKNESEKKQKLITSLQEKISETEKEKDDLNKIITQKDDEIKKLKRDLSDMEVTIEDLKKEVRDLSIDRAKVLEEKERAIAELKQTYDSLVTELSSEIVKGEIEVTQLRDKLTVQLVEKILFDSGSAEIKGTGKKVIDRVAEILRKVKDKQIRIEGHTDNKPIGARIAKRFPTNWELSSARATNVVRYLIEKGGIDPNYISAVAYAEYKPIASNDTEEGRAKNRRIEIILIPIERDLKN